MSEMNPIEREQKKKQLRGRVIDTATQDMFPRRGISHGENEEEVAEKAERHSRRKRLRRVLPEDTRNSFNITQIQLIVAVFRTASRQNYRVLRQHLCKIGVVSAALSTPITPRHDDKLSDFSRFDRIHYLICQRQHLCMGEAADNLPLLNPGRRLTALRMLDDH